MNADPRHEFMTHRKSETYACLIEDWGQSAIVGGRYDGNAVFTLVKRFSNVIQSLAKHETRCIYRYYNDNALAKSPAV